MRQHRLIDEWWRVDTPEALQSKYLLNLFAIWQSRCSANQLPSRQDFTSEELLALGGRIALIDVEDLPRRFRYRLVGTRITAALERDSTGRYFDEIYPADYYARLAAHFSCVVDDRMPLSTRATMAHSDRPYIKIEGIDMPLSSDGKRVDMILRALQFD